MVALASGDLLATAGPQLVLVDGETGAIKQKVTIEVPTGATTDIVFNGLQARLTVAAPGAHSQPLS